MRKKKKQPPAVKGTTARDPLAAVPVIAQGVEARADSNGLLQLRAAPPRKKGIMSAIAKKLGMHRHVRVDLDACGSMFWRRINGRRPLREIEAYIREQTGLDEKETKKAVVAYTKMLMQRHLIMLRIEHRREVPK